MTFIKKAPKVRSIVFENNSSSKQDINKVARELLDAVLNCDYVYLCVDEGDGRTFWKYELDVNGESLTAAQWNDEDEDSEDDESRAERRTEDNFDSYRRGDLD